MTISTTTIKDSYSGNGSTVAFTYNFKIAANTEVQVIVKTNATGAESVRAIGQALQIMLYLELEVHLVEL